MRVTSRHKMAIVALAAMATFGLAGCSAPASSDDTSASDSASPTPTEEAMDPAFDDLVGSGCAGYADAVPDGDGSIVGMSQLQVTDAAAGNPLLTTLVKAVSGQLNPAVNLVDTLNGGEFTVFAPVDDAFAKLDPATVATLQTPEGAATLSKVLTYHVVPGQILPADIVGTQTTVEGGTVEVTGSGDSLKVNDANVICGGVHTANATVYLIDSVLMPTM